MRKIIQVIYFLYVICFLCGCVSHQGITLSGLLKDINTGGSSEYAGADTPEAPASDLPHPPVVVKKEIERGDITIQPDCLLQITVHEDPNLDGSYPVNEIGAVEFGYIGPIILYNKTEKDASLKIKQVLESRAFRNATVTVRIIKASYDKIRVSGAVNKPGLIKIGAGDIISLNDALLRAGGLSPATMAPRVRIVRGGLRSAISSALEGEIYSLVNEDGKPDVPIVNLRNNDDAYVFSSIMTMRSSSKTGGSEKSVLVLGEVSRKGFYVFSGSEPFTMMHLLLKMGGLPPYANKKAIRIIRRNNDGREEEIIVNAKEILEEGDPERDVPLRNGDRVIVPARRISLF